MELVDGGRLDQFFIVCWKRSAKPAGGGVVWSRVLLDYVPCTELLFESVAATAWADAGQAD